VISKIVNIVKDYACDVSTVPGALTFFGDQLVSYIANFKAVIPTAVVGKLLNGIHFYGNRFLVASQAFDGKYLNDTSVNEPCFLYYFNQRQVSLGFGVGFQLKIFPPKGFTFKGSFSCSSLDCWGCVTGLSDVLSIIPIAKKRDILQNSSTTNSSTSFMASDFSVSQNTMCIHYICDRGTWNDNVCACVCNADNEIWTPQYGCYDALSYENGGAPPGANPTANPNNSTYDPTTDPYSSQYDSSKDPHPYYLPYTIVKPPANGGYVMTICLLILLLSILL